jgi:CheY-like chemotaxis protein
MPMSAPSILVVDDDHQVQYVLKRTLEMGGYDVRVADDGNAAMTAIRHHPADIVLLDILMPDKDGLETVLQLKREFPKTAIVAMSGATFDFLSTAQKFGAQYKIQKPIHPEKLIALIEQVRADHGKPDHTLSLASGSMTPPTAA